MRKIKVKGKWQYFDGKRRITEKEFNKPKKVKEPNKEPKKEQIDSEEGL